MRPEHESDHGPADERSVLYSWRREPQGHLRCRSLGAPSSRGRLVGRGGDEGLRRRPHRRWRAVPCRGGRGLTPRRTVPRQARPFGQGTCRADQTTWSAPTGVRCRRVATHQDARQPHGRRDRTGGLVPLAANTNASCARPDAPDRGGASRMCAARRPAFGICQPTPRISPAAHTA